LAAPGMEKEAFNIQIDRGTLIVEALSGKMHVKSGGKYTRREFDQYAFCRSFLLPEDVKREAISAKYENGLLRIWLPKRNIDSADVKNAIVIN
jgi:HSP20 family protein